MEDGPHNNKDREVEVKGGVGNTVQGRGSCMPVPGKRQTEANAAICKYATTLPSGLRGTESSFSFSGMPKKLKASAVCRDIFFFLESICMRLPVQNSTFC
jgi:hypothetical protein